MKNLKAILTEEGLSKQAGSISLSVQVVAEGVWFDGTPWKEARLRGGGAGTSGILYKTGRVVSWEYEKDASSYRDEFLSSMVGSAVFK